MKFEVFICHKNYSADDLALRLREALLDHGITAFVDQMDIPTQYQATDKWWQFRDDALCNCDTFVMIVTAGFGISSEIIKEIKLAWDNGKDIMCFRWFRMKPQLAIDLGDHIFNTKDIQQLDFSTGAELVRKFFDHYERPSAGQTKAIGTATVSVEGTAMIKRRPADGTSTTTTPIVHFEITQSIGDTQVRRVLPDVGFNIRNWKDKCIKARIEVRVMLGGRDLGLITGSTRDKKYLGYYDGKTVWNLNPYHAFFGHFGVPEECVLSKETLTLVVTAKFEDDNGKKFNYLPVSCTFVRETNSWFSEPTEL
ncbi:MAG: TIR domain-containing protein [Candidatus Bathyarchaeia archaeon]